MKKGRDAHCGSGGGDGAQRTGEESKLKSEGKGEGGICTCVWVVASVESTNG